MKRFFFSLIALSAAAIGCTQSALLETPDLDGTAVSFSPYTGRTPESKASSIAQPDEDGNLPAGAITLADAGGFYVYSFLKRDGIEERELYLENELVSSNDNGATWSYGNVIYWPSVDSKSSLDFVAYSANGVGKGLDVTKEGFTFTVQQDVASQVDLMATAYQAGNTVNSNNGSVTLHFYHLLSRVGFKIQASQTNENRMIKISNLALKGKMPKVGTLNFTDYKGTQKPALTVSAESSHFVDGYTLISSETEFASKSSVEVLPNNTNRFMMIMPHANENNDHYIEITYAIGTKTSSTSTAYSSPKTVTLDLPSDFSFVAGNAYEFVLQISTSKLSFDIIEQPWDTDDYDADQNKDNNQDFPLEPEDQNVITLGSAYVTGAKTAKIPVTVNKSGLNEVLVQFKKVGDSNWETSNATIDKTSGNTTEVLLEGLNSNTEYNYRASVKLSDSNDTPTYYYPTENSQLSFMTYASVAFDYGKDSENKDLTFEQWKESNVTPFTANVKAIYSSDNNNPEYEITEWGFCWARGSVAPTINDFKAAAENSTNGTYNMLIENLVDNTEYSVRAYVKNKKGKVSYSENITFRTKYYYEDSNDDTGAGGLTPNAQ